MMRLTVIGCYGAYPDPGGASSGYLLEEGETKVLLDCGSGVLSKLQQVIDLSELDAVVFSHYHADHCADLGCLHYAAMIDTQLGRRTKPLVLWGPGETERLTYKTSSNGQSYLGLSAFAIGDLRFTVCENIHEIPSWSIRITDPDGVSLVYSGDTGYHEALADFAAGTDCFLCESSFYEGNRPAGALHLSADQAALLARKANVRKLILTHLPHFGDPRQLQEQAGRLFEGEVLLAHSGMHVVLSGLSKEL